MLTISRLADYAGVTVATVRHYHRIGLLPEPERNHSGYRTYDAAALVRLLRIKVLADSGVPLARVGELLDADDASFSGAVEEIDTRLRAKIRGLRDTRGRLARLASAERLALPESVIDYLTRLRAMGVTERYIELERDAWIVVAAQLPGEIEAIMEKKSQDLDDPDVRRLYVLVCEALDWEADDPRVIEIADIFSRINAKARVSGGADDFPLDDGVVALLDAGAEKSSPLMSRLFDLLEQRGWKGLTRFEPIEESRGPRPGTSGPGAYGE